MIEELIAMGSTPEEAERVAKFMHADRERQQYGWKKIRRGEVADTEMMENLDPLVADRSHTQPGDVDDEGWKNEMWGHGKGNTDG